MFEMSLIMLGPLLTYLQTYAGFLFKTKIKAHTKLTVVMWCQIFDRKSRAPSCSDNRRQLAPRQACGQDEKNKKEEKMFSKASLDSLDAG